MTRVGVIGAGSMGQNHARVYSEVAELVGVCDSDPAVGESAAKRFGSRFFQSHEELLRQDVTAVSIATPTTLHYEIAKAALDRGVHVLLEKPFTGDVEEAEALAERAAEMGLVIAAGMVERHNPCVEFAHTALREGRYGKLITVSSRRVSAFPTRVRDVGVMMDLGIHDVDVMRYLVGEEVVGVYSVGGRERHESYEDHATALLTFRGGVNGVIEVNWLTPMKVRKLSLTCLKNFVELDYVNQAVEISSSRLMEYDPSDLYQAPFEYDVRQVALEKQEPLKREIEDFLRAAEHGARPLVDGAEAVDTLKVVRAIMESRAKGGPVEVS